MSPEKDPTNYDLLTYAWVFALSAWGGAVNFYRKMRDGKTRPFNFTELVGELVTSAFAGILTFWLCELSSFPPLLSAALVGIAGHMGSRAIFRFEKMLDAKFPADKPEGT